jgi:hypothetical protein
MNIQKNSFDPVTCELVSFSIRKLLLLSHKALQNMRISVLEHVMKYLSDTETGCL